jgi:hypothetical protein
VRLAILSTLAISLLAASALTGCASDSAPTNEGNPLDDGGGTGTDASSISYDSGNPNPGNDSGNGGQCVSHCTSDLDCQNSCPAVTGGSNCCDVPTGHCYASPTATCPTPNLDAGNGID